LFGERFCRNIPVVNLIAAFQQMQTGYAKRLFGKVNAGYFGAALRHAFRQNAAATANINNLLPSKSGVLVDPLQAKRIDGVQWFEFAVRIPPAMSELAEFVEFVLVGVEHGIQAFEEWKQKSPAEAGLF
jgi:hypothetical protein